MKTLPRIYSAAKQSVGGSYVIDTTTVADHDAQGLIRNNAVTGETVALFDALYVKSDGKYWLAKADATSTMVACGLALAAGSAGTGKRVLHRGIVYDASWTGGTAWTKGGLLYVSAGTAGALTQTKPAVSTNVVQIVGIALETNMILFDPDFTYVIVA